MNEKLIYYQNLAAKTVKEIYSGSDYWMTFLNTASKIYKYSFVDQILIHAQMPEATACAEYRIWNDTMHRYIKKGSKGIALLSETDAGIGLRYVYDISCTGTRRNSRNVDAFVYRKEHEPAVFSVLGDGNSLEEKLFLCAKYLFSENYNENISQSADLLDKSDEIRYNKDTEETMLNFAAASAAYMAMHRMGQTSVICRQLLTTTDYVNLSDHIKLGNSISKVGGTILRQMEFLCKTYDKEHTNAQEEMHHENNEHRSEEHTDELSRNDGTERDHLPTGGRRVSAADRRGRQPDEAPGQVGTDAPDVPEGAQIGDIQRDASDGDTDAAPVGDRGESTDDVREPDDVFGGAEQRDGTDEVGESDAVGTDDEQPAGDSRGDDSDGADLQLTEELSEEEQISSETGFPAPITGVQLNLFDEAIYEAEQIAYIDEAESKPSLPFAFHFSQEIIDTVLKYGGNERDARMRIVAEFMKDKTVEEHGEFLRNLFHGGNGFKVDSRDICAWYDDDGVRLAHGRSARYIHDSAVQTVSWTDAAVRIEELLLQGQFASNVEITEAARHERLLLLCRYGDSSYVCDYTTERIDGERYMFVDWKSYEYRFGGKPVVLVLRQYDNRPYTAEALARKDNIALPFTDDPQVIGTWKAIALTASPDTFDPTEPVTRKLFFSRVTFLGDGAVESVYGDKIISGEDMQVWTRGYLLRKWNRTACAYEIRRFDGIEFLFLEWKNGDYIWGGREPKWYVFCRA